MDIKTLLTDEEIEAWLLNRLGGGNRFEQFNRQFCRDFADYVDAKTKRVIWGWLGRRIYSPMGILDEYVSLKVKDWGEFKKWALGE